MLRWRELYVAYTILVPPKKGLDAPKRGVGLAQLERRQEFNGRGHSISKMNKMRKYTYRGCSSHKLEPNF